MENFKKFLKKAKDVIDRVYENTIAHYIKSLFGKPVSILFLGIDNAGKTTLLNKLKNETVGAHTPTHHSNKTEVEIGKMRVNIIDLGGHRVARMAWKDYFFGCDGVIFVVDVSDVERFNEVRSAFQTVVKTDGGVPIAVLFNKIDKYGYDSEMAESDYNFTENLKAQTGIENNLGVGNPVMVSYVSIVKESPTNLSGSLVKSFQWLEKMISMKSKTEI